MAERRDPFPIGTAALVLLWLVLAGAAMLWWRSASKPVSAELQNLLRAEPRTLTTFSLVDQQERSFTEANLQGRWTFLFFGYSYCPDICPTTLATLKQVMALLRQQPADAANVQVVFVSVDPDRDTPALLQTYVHYFDPAFIGVTGRPSQIEQLAAQVGAGYRKEAPQGSGQYLISHTASVFLSNPLGQILLSFPPPLYADKIASLFRELRGFY